MSGERAGAGVGRLAVVAAAATVLATVLASAGACGGGEAPPSPPAIEYGEDVCAECGMIISDPRFATAMAVRTRSGDTGVRAFDDVAGPLLYLRDRPGIEVLSVWVHDCRSGAWTPADSARFVRSGNIRSPMAHGLLPCGSPGAADSVARALGGEVLRWEDVRDAARRGAFDPDRLRPRRSPDTAASRPGGGGD